MVLDMEADMDIIHEVDKEVANVVNEYVGGWEVLVISGESPDKCRCCATNLMLEEFKGPHGHYTVQTVEMPSAYDYALKHFLVGTTWRCT